MSKTTVIYHSGDMDGIFCREIAKRFLGHDPDCDSKYIGLDGVRKPCTCREFVGWNFGDWKIVPPANEGRVYILDLSPDCVEKFNGWNERLIWIDHHATSVAKWSSTIPGYRIDGVAACRLAWQWFCNSFNGYGAKQNFGEPSFIQSLERRHFMERLVKEPLAVRLAGEYDVWTKGPDGNLLPDLHEFQCGLRAVPDLDYQRLLASDDYAETVLVIGRSVAYYAKTCDASAAKRAYLLDWEGLRWLALNSARLNSLTFASRDVPETGHDALLGYGFDGRQWTVSLYHARHRTDLDLSAVAVKYGGGGHKGACGFQCASLPFETEGAA